MKHILNTSLTCMYIHCKSFNKQYSIGKLVIIRTWKNDTNRYIGNYIPKIGNCFSKSDFDTDVSDLSPLYIKA